MISGSQATVSCVRGEKVMGKEKRKRDSQRTRTKAIATFTASLPIL